MNADQSTRRWKWVAVVSIVVAIGLLITLVAVPIRITRISDDRLIGTWQSDAERTIAINKGRISPEFSKIFGKLRVTYTPTTFSTELDGYTDFYKYKVLGKEKHTAVIHEVKEKPLPLEEMIGLSSFMVIHFDGPDAYWVYTEMGGLQEYFKRVK